MSLPGCGLVFVRGFYLGIMYVDLYDVLMVMGNVSGLCLGVR